VSPLRPPAARRPRRASKLILVVTEGTETEPRYLGSLRAFLRLGGLKVKSATTSAPLQVVRDAIRLREEAARQALRTSFQEPFDEVWAVFDDDQRGNIREAIEMAAQNGVMLAFSRPCFELWLLLHFTPALKPYPSCKDVARDLRAHFPDFEKASDLDGLVQLHRIASANAAFLEGKLKEAGREAYPFTTMHHLVQDLTR